ncbi:MAG: D-tyrosyl-tRNA(Tyr) deacylase [Candidatus Delongbacteria bacterium]|nr:D-tyrosyl-tRNA(Tyr) deacylase [Candidatus Delongbacteria bacterium]MBN2834600.1 D-tyrosyl-tRNA(Tyr) deacylase [Candidatus Delongbacteria bacterium]
MKILLQRVIKSEVKIDDRTYSSTERGLLLFIGFTHSDNLNTIDFLVNKVLNLRIFEDDNGKMNLSVMDKQGEIMLVSQFTLYGDTSRGRRPGFENSMKPEKASELFDKTVEYFKRSGLKIGTGVFGAEMQVSLVNDGPVTFLLEKEI